MSKYRLSEEEIAKIREFWPENAPYWMGRNAESKRLIPILEEKDALLRECREMIQTIIVEGVSLKMWKEDAPSLLTKLKRYED